MGGHDQSVGVEEAVRVFLLLRRQGCPGVSVCGHQGRRLPLPGQVLLVQGGAPLSPSVQPRDCLVGREEGIFPPHPEGSDPAAERADSLHGRFAPGLPLLGGRGRCGSEREGLLFALPLPFREGPEGPEAASLPEEDSSPKSPRPLQPGCAWLSRRFSLGRFWGEEHSAASPLPQIAVLL